jgi:glycosyltransferase involved in cell wall biosynthesis
MNKQIDILLATYQGEAYVEEQIDSILKQTYPFIHIWIRDDGSSDQTPLLIQNLANQHPGRISILPSHLNLGIKQNFSTLMQYSQSPYIMFSDQDDYWTPHKVEASLALMIEEENKQGNQTPILIHTDLIVADSHLGKLANSYWNYSHLNPHATTLNRLLTQNMITGCTMLINRSLLNLSSPIPKETIMHDWWIALVASAFGSIKHIPFPTLFYRQHDSNDIGAKRYEIKRVLTRTKKDKEKQQECRDQTYAQAQVFLDRYRDLLSHSQQEIIQVYASLRHLSDWQQRKQMIKYRFFKHGFLRTLKSFLFIKE